MNPGIPAMVLGVCAVLPLAPAFAAGNAGWGWFLVALLFAMVGTPVSVIALVHQVRSRLPFTVALVGLVLCSVPLLLLGAGVLLGLS